MVKYGDSREKQWGEGETSCLFNLIQPTVVEPNWTTQQQNAIYAEGIYPDIVIYPVIYPVAMSHS